MKAIISSTTSKAEKHYNDNYYNIIIMRVAVVIVVALLQQQEVQSFPSIQQQQYGTYNNIQLISSRKGGKYHSPTLPSFELNVFESSSRTSTTTTTGSNGAENVIENDEYSNTNNTWKVSRLISFFDVTTTSSKFAATTTTTSNVNTKASENSLIVTTKMNIQALKESIDRVGTIFSSLLQNYWWLFPILLCLVPVYSTTILNTLPVTPEFWKLVNMEFVHAYDYAKVWIAGFLGSNISYFMAAAYILLNRPTNNNNNNNRSTNYQQRSTTRLSAWVCAAGIMSTIFHTFQALHDYRIAEALCYADHGIAGSATFYFIHRCGRPSTRTLVLGTLGLVALTYPCSYYPNAYTFLHSIWHFLSASAAVTWVQDSHKETTMTTTTTTTN